MSLKCPKCGAAYDKISNVEDIQDLLGVNESDKKWMCNRCSYFFDQDVEKYYNELTIDDLGYEILHEWKDIPQKAFVYADSITKLNNINDNIGYDSGKIIIEYFLLNSRGWNGEVARKIKEELKKRLKHNDELIQFVEFCESCINSNKNSVDLDIAYDSNNKSFYYNGIQITKNSVADNLGDEVAEKILKWIKK